MFYDYAKVYIKSGDGGNGIVAFRREKFVPLGGPSGGDGGRGADVILRGDSGLSTLMDFKYKQHYKAGRGENGQNKNRHGAWAEPLVLRVPLGTIIRNAETGNLLGDIVEHGQELIIAKGGRGGRGNARFATQTTPAPYIAEKGEPGQELWITMELKLLADVGLIGLPNAGKSTL
ncbi:MAG: GTPase ObgE, partial [Clostridia bacterium]|nr:GTPase ObgE [Clostridia bacterium]